MLLPLYERYGIQDCERKVCCGSTQQFGLRKLMLKGWLPELKIPPARLEVRKNFFSAKSLRKMEQHRYLVRSKH